MSFAQNFKLEILSHELVTNAEKLAFVSAVMRVLGSIHIDSKGRNIEIDSENNTLIQKFCFYLKELYDIDIEIDMQKHSNLQEKSYKAKLPYSYTDKIAEDTNFIIYIGGQAVGFSNGVEADFTSEAELKAYLLGIVASAVSITVPQEIEGGTYSGSYHLEMTFTNENLAYDIMNYLAQFDIFLKKITRGDFYSLYIKDSNMISDFMAFFGGNNAVLELNNIIAYRSLRNDVNRANNCMLANMDKTILAGQKQYMAIKTIEEKIGLDKLPEKLKELAIVRLNHPDYTLDNIALELGGVGKSGINHRFRKLMEIASKLEEDSENE